MIEKDFNDYLYSKSLELEPRNSKAPIKFVSSLPCELIIVSFISNTVSHAGSTYVWVHSLYSRQLNGCFIGCFSPRSHLVVVDLSLIAWRWFGVFQVVKSWFAPVHNTSNAGILKLTIVGILERSPVSV